MKTLPCLLLPLLLLLASCVQKPSVTHILRDGSIIRYNAGTVVAAKEAATVTEITAPDGTNIKHMSEGIDATEVPNNLITAGAAVKIAGHLGNTTRHAASMKTQEAIGAQSVQMNKDTLDAAGKVTTEAIPLVEGGPELLPIKPPGS